MYCDNHAVKGQPDPGHFVKFVNRDLFRKFFLGRATSEVNSAEKANPQLSVGNDDKGGRGGDDGRGRGDGGSSVGQEMDEKVDEEVEIL